jgi:hypothetical protein
VVNQEEGDGNECGMYGGDAYRVLVGKLEGNRPPGITRCRRENIIKVDLKKQGFGMWHVWGWCVQSLGGKLERKRPPGITKHR